MNSYYIAFKEVFQYFILRIMLTFKEQPRLISWSRITLADRKFLVYIIVVINNKTKWGLHVRLIDIKEYWMKINRVYQRSASAYSCHDLNGYIHKQCKYLQTGAKILHALLINKVVHG